MKKIIRVGVMNNFNFTQKEIEACKRFEQYGKLFVNSNSFVTIRSDYPSFITINPYLRFVEPQGDLSNVKACRIKIVLNGTPNQYRDTLKAFEYCFNNNIPALITWMRFWKFDTLRKYVLQPYNSHYSFRYGYFRPDDNAKAEYLKFLKKKYSDYKGLIKECSGNCLTCRNCIRLSYGSHYLASYEICSLNLSCSGDNGNCIFSCPDCFAKRLAQRNGSICVDKIIKNAKQRGKANY